MKEKIMNWLEKHNYIYATGLFVVSLCMIAFGFANFGTGAEPSDEVDATALYAQEVEEEFTAE